MCPWPRGLARRGWRVLCPDLPGHGVSDHLPDAEDYGGTVYRSVLLSTIAASGAAAVDLVGSSMGAALAMRIAASHPQKIRRLILNDGGAYAPRAALERVLSLVPATTVFDSREAADAALRRYRQDCDPLPPDDWRALADAGIEENGGAWRLRYDPRLVGKLAAASEQDQAQWQRWDAVACPVLLIRGERSEMLSQALASTMIARKPGTQIVTVRGCGHRPWLRSPSQVRAITAWLAGDPKSA
jgi:pimeloyl-ACP methyl ester carboxylesterase